MNAPSKRLQRWFASGLEQQQSGRYERAEKTYRKILKHQPGHSGVLVNLAIVQWRQGRLKPARVNAVKATQAGTNMASAFAILGAIDHDLGDHMAAIQSLKKATELDPGLGPAYSGLATACFALRKWPDTIQACRKVLSLTGPETVADPSIYTCLGAALKAQGHLNEAERCFREMCEKHPGAPSAFENLASILADLGEYDEARAMIEGQLADTPERPGLWNTLGNLCVTAGDNEAAREAYRRALAIDPDFVDAGYNLGLMDLCEGHLDRGWTGFERRLDLSHLNIPGIPCWDGTPAPVGCLLIVCEQGLGDTLHFIRYAALARTLVGRIVLLCQSPLRDYLKRMPELDDVVVFGEALADCDFYIPLLSLPGIFTPSLADIPGTVPYLPVPKIEAVKDHDNVSVGLNWAGSPDNPTDYKRSVPLADFIPLLDMPNCRFFSLQYGEHGDDIKTLGLDDKITDLRPHLNGFLDTAKTIQQLDLVISVCTSTAHLAGGMGQPVWVLVARDGDWRWFKDRDDSPWYPTARLFRQTEPRHWSDVIKNVHKALSVRVEGG